MQIWSRSQRALRRDPKSVPSPGEPDQDDRTSHVKAGYNFTDIILSQLLRSARPRRLRLRHTVTISADQQPSGGDISGVSGERTFGAPSGVPEGFLQNSAYFNDDFRVRSNLTLNLGFAMKSLPCRWLRAPSSTRDCRRSRRDRLQAIHGQQERLVSTLRLCLFSGKRSENGPSAAASADPSISPMPTSATNANPPYYQVTRT